MPVGSFSIVLHMDCGQDTCAHKKVLYSRSPHSWLDLHFINNYCTLVCFFKIPVSLPCLSMLKQATVSNSNSGVKNATVKNPKSCTTRHTIHKKNIWIPLICNPFRTSFLLSMLSPQSHLQYYSILSQIGVRIQIGFYKWLLSHQSRFIAIIRHI